MKNVYCTLDTEVAGGASNPKGIYHLAGIIHDRKGSIEACFNYIIAEHFHKIASKNYVKRNIKKYAEMIQNGVVTVIDTETHAIEMVSNLCKFYNVKYVMAFNSGFDLRKTACKVLLNDYEFIDIWLIALQTLTFRKKYAKFCKINGFMSSSKKSCSTTAQTIYAYLINDPSFREEHTALEDAKIGMAIFVGCIKTHKKFTKNCHTFNYSNCKTLFPKF